jgi:hypothetical protein
MEMPVPVMTITGSLGCLATRVVMRPQPETPGIERSVTSRSAIRSRNRETASSALLTVTTSYPSCVRLSRNTSRTLAASSTTKTRGRGVKPASG